MVKEIRVYGKTRKAEGGQEFVTFSFTNNGKDFYDVKFGKSCLTRPNEVGYWLLSVDTDKLSVQKKHKEDNNLNDILWVHEVKSCIKDTAYEEAKQEEKKNAVLEIFK